jgi:hypothetical protein
MANATNVIVHGKCRWCFTRKLDQNGEWSMNLYPNPESLDIINQLIKDGIKNQLKKDDDGYYIRFRRHPQKQGKDGRVIQFDPPETLNADGSICTDIIGDGSDVSVRLEVYGGKNPFGTGSYKAARLGGVKVQNLVPYIPATMAKDEHEQKNAQRLMAAPLQQPSW